MVEGVPQIQSKVFQIGSLPFWAVFISISCHLLLIGGGSDQGLVGGHVRGGSGRDGVLGMVRGPSAEALLPALLITRALPPCSQRGFSSEEHTVEAGSAVSTAPHPVPHAQATPGH